MRPCAGSAETGLVHSRTWHCILRLLEDSRYSILQHACMQDVCFPPRHGVGMGEKGVEEFVSCAASLPCRAFPGELSMAARLKHDRFMGVGSRISLSRVSWNI